MPKDGHEHRLGHSIRRRLELGQDLASKHRNTGSGRYRVCCRLECT